MSLRSQLGRIRNGVVEALYRRAMPLGASGPIVSFTFDDFPRSACSAGGSILEKFGARGTYYLAAGLANTSGELGDFFVEADLHFLRKAGHEIASHTYQHSSCRKLSMPEFQADVRHGLEAVQRLTGHNSGNFAYPFGAVTLAAKKTLESHLTSARSILPGLNGPQIDLNLLRANQLYGGLNASKHAERLIQQNVHQKRWLIFYTHDVRPTPSQYGCTPELFEFAVSRAAHSGSRILTVEEVLRELGAAPVEMAHPPESDDFAVGSRRH